MATTLRIRHRLLYTALLGAITSALALVALERALTMSAAQRVERARDAVTSELDRLALLPASGSALAAPARSTYVGLHGGWLVDVAEVEKVELPPAWQPALSRTVGDAARSHKSAVTQTALGQSTLILAAAPSSSASLGYAWTGFLLQPSAYLRPWRYIAFGLTISTGLLVASTLGSAIWLRRNTRALNATLQALGKDLTTPVPQPRIHELSAIADGIRRMAADLSHSREVTAQLQRELAQRERLAALGRVAAGVAHEVRNPLASIKLRLDLTLSGNGKDLPAPVQASVRAASDEIARLDRLVGDLLLVAGKKMGPRRTVELGALVQARAEAMAPWAASRGVALVAEGRGDAEVDGESVARAIDNVLRNAVEATPSGGNGQSTVSATVQVAGAAVEVCVEDHGCGVEPGRVSELFEPFFTTKSDGTGLGLAISRAIARAHGGDLVYARLGDITRFSLSLPVHPESGA